MREYMCLNCIHLSTFISKFQKKIFYQGIPSNQFSSRCWSGRWQFSYTSLKPRNECIRYSVTRTSSFPIQHKFHIFPIFHYLFGFSDLSQLISCKGLTFCNVCMLHYHMSENYRCIVYFAPSSYLSCYIYTNYNH